MRSLRLKGFIGEVNVCKVEIDGGFVFRMKEGKRNGRVLSLNCRDRG